MTDVQGLISSIRNKEQTRIEEFDVMIEEIYLTEDDDVANYNDELDKRMLYHFELIISYYSHRLLQKVYKMIILKGFVEIN